MHYPLMISVHDEGQNQMFSGKSWLSPARQVSSLLPFLKVQLRSEISGEIQRRLNSGKGIIPLPAFGISSTGHSVDGVTVCKIVLHNLKQLWK